MNNRFKIGDKVVGKNIFGKSRLPLIVIDIPQKGVYQCQVEQTDIDMPYLEEELELR